MNVIEQGSHILLAQSVISTPSNDNSRVHWQVTHSVAESRAWWLTISLYMNEFTLDYFAIYCHRLEITKLIHQFSIALLSTEIVNTILNSITL